MAEVMCDCCGGKHDGPESTLTGSWPVDVHGSRLCISCRKEYRRIAGEKDEEGCTAHNAIAEISGRIRARRRSEAGRGPLSAEGRPVLDQAGAVVTVGCWLSDGGATRGPVTEVGRDGPVTYAALADNPENRALNLAKYWRVVEPPTAAQPAEKAKETTCDNCGGSVMRDAVMKVDGNDWCQSCFSKPKTPGGSVAGAPSDAAGPIPSGRAEPPGVTKRHGYVVGIDWASVGKGSIRAADALGEVENQLALVARLDFDLKMLKLLGQGWSRGDLAAHLARLTPGGRK